MATRTQVFTTSGTFNVPSDITSAWLTMIGGGGGAGGCNPQPGYGGGGGGAGEYVTAMPVKVTAGGTVAITVGAGGLGGQATGTAGGDTSFGVITVKGGKPGKNNALFGVQTSGDGGGDLGGHISVGGVGVIGGLSPFHFAGGGCGGWSALAIGDNGYRGSNAINGNAGGVGGTGQCAGGGGAASPFGSGGAGADWVNLVPHNGTAASGTAYGAGGGGGSAGNIAGRTSSGGNGAGGYCLIMWID